MPAQTDINFIPDSIVKEKKVQYTKKVGTRASLIIMLCVALVAAGFLFYNLTLDRKIHTNITETEIKRNEISELKKFGEDGYMLGLRLENADNIINNRGIISILSSELYKRLPSNVTIVEWSYSKEKNLMLRGTVPGTYDPIELYKVELLKNPDDGSSNLFSDVKLKNATYDKEKGLVTFELGIMVNSEVLNGR